MPYPLKNSDFDIENDDPLYSLSLNLFNWHFDLSYVQDTMPGPVGNVKSKKRNLFLHYNNVYWMVGLNVLNQYTPRKIKQYSYDGH